MLLIQTFSSCVWSIFPIFLILIDCTFILSHYLLIGLILDAMLVFLAFVLMLVFIVIVNNIVVVINIDEVVVLM